MVCNAKKRSTNSTAAQNSESLVPAESAQPSHRENPRPRLVTGARFEYPISNKEFPREYPISNKEFPMSNLALG